MTAKFGEPDHYVSVAKEIIRRNSEFIFPVSIFKPLESRCSLQYNRPEIWNDTEGKITHFVSGVGTGGTITALQNI
jgi:cystathionine beta-synthase